MTTRERKEIKEKFLRGLELSYEKMLTDKRAKNAEIVIMRDNKIVTIKP